MLSSAVAAYERHNKEAKRCLGGILICIALQKSRIYIKTSLEEDYSSLIFIIYICPLVKTFLIFFYPL